ncbi:hypothetical protein CR513_49068, partial [Mucuna pruriens]
MLPRLQKFYLRNLPLVRHIIQNLISNSHSIEDLRIIKCLGLKKIEINTPNLDTFWYCDKKTTSWKLLWTRAFPNNL